MLENLVSGKTCAGLLGLLLVGKGVNFVEVEECKNFDAS